jgi:hypothetical protein
MRVSRERLACRPNSDRPANQLQSHAIPYVADLRSPVAVTGLARNQFAIRRIPLPLKRL